MQTPIEIGPNLKQVIDGVIMVVMCIIGAYFAVKFWK